MTNPGKNYDIGQTLNDLMKDCPDKEVRIINAAINTFSEKGFEATRTREIAEKAGIAEGTIFRYFPTKDAILNRMVPLLIEVMQPRLEKPVRDIVDSAADRPMGEVLEAVLTDRLRIIRDNRRFLKSVLPALIHRPALLTTLGDSVIPMIRSYISRVADNARRRGEIDEGVRTDIIMDQLLGFIIAYSLLSWPEDEERMAADVRDFIKYAMEGWRKA